MKGNQTSLDPRGPTRVGTANVPLKGTGRNGAKSQEPKNPSNRTSLDPKTRGVGRA